ncbi:UNVERIFIED_ORG: colicin import membrane protein [Arthrobacter globiformis]|nr:colicin import membrane protein [Arthrobacter globiformis]
MNESDGIEEAIEGMSRIGLTVAGRLGEQLARAREQELRRGQAAEEQQARELQARFDAERAAARAQLAPVMDNRWWDTASGRDVERVHEVATAWKDHDPAARDAADVIRDQVQRRYGLDVDTLGADDASVAQALAKAERDREQAEQERRAGRDETAQAVQLLAEADREDRDRQQDADEENQRPEALAEEAGLKHDSADRRQALAASLESVPDREAVQARLSADQDQATPPTAAVTKTPGRNPKARKTRGANGQTKLLQKGMSR